MLAWLEPQGVCPCEDSHGLAFGLLNPTTVQVFAAQGVVRVGRIDYRLFYAIFRSEHGVRAWVAVQPRPSMVYAEAAYLMLLKHDGQIFCGTLHALALLHGKTQ